MQDLTILNTANFTWARATKTKAILAMQMLKVFPSPEIAAMFLLKTLEANEPVDMNAVLCVGASGEPWQQSYTSLLKKYEAPNDIAQEFGWTAYTPLPSNEVEVFIADTAGYIIGRYGETIDGFENLQRVRLGDAIVRQTYDRGDQWVVRQDLFAATYEVLV